jgi:uncharacterized iron-regulated membrane protein
LTIHYSVTYTRLNFDLHRVCGIYVALVLLVVGFSGVYMIFPAYVQPLVQLVSPLIDGPRALKSTPLSDQRPLTPSQAIAVADTVFPHAELMEISLTSLGLEGVYAVYKRQPGEVRKSKGSSIAWVDQYRGDILHIRDPRTMSAGDRLLLWQFPLHNGEAFGLTGRIITLITGLSLPLLYVTGVFIWWRKRRAHQRARRIV